MSQYDAMSLENPIGPSIGGPSASDDLSLLDQIKQDPTAAAARVLRQWEESTALLKPYFAQWKINRARNAGYTGMRMVKVQNEARAFFPLGSTPSQTTTNKAARLTRRLRATVFTDPPVPEAIPSSDDDEDRDAADTTTRILTDVCGDHNIAYALTMGDAFDLASMHGSGFVRFWIDPQGGGKDEQTGAWVPTVKRELLTGRNVRLLPDSAADIWDASGVLIGSLVPLSELRRTFGPALEKLDETALGALSGYRPPQAEELLPIGRKDRKQSPGGDPLVFVLTIIHHQDPVSYPDGCYAILLGGAEWVHSGSWLDPRRGTALDLPLTQVKQIPDEDNPYGRGIMEFLGPGNEVRQSLEASFDEHLRRFTSRKTFVPLHSNLQPEQLQAETRTYLPIVPNGAPVNEEIPDFPNSVVESYDRITREMDDESGLQETGQGLAPTSVRSGTHAQAIVSQVNVGLSQLSQSTARAIERGWEIILQQIRAFVDTELILRWQAEGGAFKVKRWSVSDLKGTTDVRIQRGSFTQMSAMHKAEVVASYVQQQFLSPMEAQHLIRGQVGTLIGLQDNPHRLRVRRQIAAWEQGPPPDAVPPPPVLDPQTGAPSPQPDPQAIQLFAPQPVDQQPDVAQIRADELGRALAGMKAEKFPPEWVLALSQAYETARVAAGIQTVQDQQRAMQQQQQMQQQALQQQEAAKQSQEADVGQLAQQVEKALQQLMKQVQATGQQTEQLEAKLNEHIATMTAEIPAIRREIDQGREMARMPSGNGGMAGLKVEMKPTDELAAALSQQVTGTHEAMVSQQQQLGMDLQNAVAALQQAIEHLIATRPVGATVTTDKQGKITGVVLQRPGSN